MGFLRKNFRFRFLSDISPGRNLIFLVKIPFENPPETPLVFSPRTFPGILLQIQPKPTLGISPWNGA